MGEFDDYVVTCDALGALLSKYTSLTELDLDAKEFGNFHGPLFASVLGTCSHLCKLDLSNNSWDTGVSEDIRTAWTGTRTNFLLER